MTLSAEESAISLSESAEVLPMTVESECSVPLVSPSLIKTANETGEGGQALAKVASVKLSDKTELLSQCNFKIACDVTNPLCGFQGATYIYGPQKGVTSEMLPVLDAGMENYRKSYCRM